MGTMEAARANRARSRVAVRPRRTVLGAAAVALTWATLATAQAEPAPAPLGLATAPAPSAAAPVPGAAAAPAATADPLERARQGVVVIERGGRALAVGTLLRGDGRIVTALSTLGHGNDLEARYPDGSRHPVRVDHASRAWDLALLLPEAGDAAIGLRAARQTARAGDAGLRRFTVVGARVAPARVVVKGERPHVGGDSEVLSDALELGTPVRDVDLGSPVVDSAGDVVAVLARACSPTTTKACALVPYGVPVRALKAFLRGAPRSRLPQRPWLGVDGTAEDTGVVRGVRVLGAGGPPPAAARLAAGSGVTDGALIVAVDGRPVTSPAALASEIQWRAAGSDVELLVFRGGSFRAMTVTLGSAPPTNRDTGHPAAGHAPRPAPPGGPPGPR
jgi:serine protease Do